MRSLIAILSLLLTCCIVALLGWCAWYIWKPLFWAFLIPVGLLAPKYFLKFVIRLRSIRLITNLKKLLPQKSIDLVNSKGGTLKEQINLLALQLDVQVKTIELIDTYKKQLPEGIVVAVEKMDLEIEDQLVAYERLHLAHYGKITDEEQVKSKM